MKSERDPEIQQEIAKINEDKELTPDEKKMIVELGLFRYETLEELAAAVGELTEEEKAIRARVNFSAEPTDEEIIALGINFTKLFNTGNERVKSDESTKQA